MLDAAPHTRLDGLEPDPFLARCGSYWAVTQTHPQAERWARDNLERQGYSTFLPLVRVRQPDRATPTIHHVVTRPLFTSYLFVRIDSPLWAPIRHTFGVRRLLLDGEGRPGIVAEAAIEALQAVQDLPAPPTPWEPGTPCSLAAGPFAGLPAVVTAQHLDEATIAVMFLGHLRTIRVPLDALAPRGET
jgi:transcriptional antiterminator RfaH